MSGAWHRLRAGEAPPEVAVGEPQTLHAPLGQGEAFARAVAQARRLALHHAVLLTGARGAGKSTAARWLAAALLCESATPDAPCAACRPCRMVATGNHPDLDRLEVPEDKTAIPVESVREAQTRLLLRPHEGRARALCIDPADRLTEEAQNALLKTLEEPPPGTFLLLCASRPEALVPTVRSRALPLRLLPLSDEVVLQELLRRLPDAGERQGRAVALARGSLGLALELCAERAVQLHDLVLAALSDSESLRAVEIARKALADAADRREQVERARLFLSIARAEARRRLHGPLETRPQDAYSPPPVDRWTAWIEHALTAEEDLELQIPPEQALCGCLLRTRETV